VAKLFFLLSGEHETLPTYELEAILEAEGYAFKILEKLDQTLRLEADTQCIEAIKQRAAFTKLCGLELFSCQAEKTEILKAIHSINLNKFFKENESFAVRIKRVKDYASNIDSMTLERKLGEFILNKTAKINVNLENPTKTFVGILTDKKFIFGVKIADISPKPFIERRPKKKPFFHPSAMQAKLARCMVNLAKPKKGEIVFDPFCGTGGILIEAELVGCRVLGLDIQRHMVRGSLKNMAYFSIKPEGVMVADARKPPVTKIDCVVTDPPYGKSATTMRRTTRQIVEEVLMAVHDMLGKGRRVCMAAPKTLNIGEIATALGYKHLHSHFVYIHRSLTREIAILEKV
jgi:tRNA (guanine10-N2)-dimethyltransferase